MSLLVPCNAALVLRVKLQLIHKFIHGFSCYLSFLIRYVRCVTPLIWWLAAAVVVVLPAQRARANSWNKKSF